MTDLLAAIFVAFNYEKKDNQSCTFRAMNVHKAYLILIQASEVKVSVCVCTRKRRRFLWVATLILLYLLLRFAPVTTLQAVYTEKQNIA